MIGIDTSTDYGGFTMKKRIALILCFALLMSALAGCMGTVVVYNECTCPGGTHTGNNDYQPTEGALKTGLAIITGIGESENAKQAKYDITIAAVTVDDNGVIQDCIIDSVGATITFDDKGVITSDLTAEVLTKNELGDNYGMKAYGSAKYEWYEQAAALANYAKGKTVAELKNGAVGESGKAVDADLASTATIYLGGYVSAIEQAVSSAQHLGAQSGDELKLSVINGASGTDATAEKAGTAQLDCNVAVLTVKDGVITSCVIDAVQAKVSFDTTGAISTDLTAAVQTKNQLGENYGMKAWGSAKYEWNEQAASFAKYVTGKTAAQVAGIAVSEGKPSDADLAATVTIAIGDFQALIAKAFG